MTYAINHADIDLLRSAGVSDEDIRHCVKVAEKALEIALSIGGKGIDQELVGRGGLFHDLGKAKTHEMEHGKIGAELGKQIGLPTAITDIMEKHIRGGLTEPEARELGLPVKDYTLDPFGKASPGRRVDLDDEPEGKDPFHKADDLQ